MNRVTANTPEKRPDLEITIQDWAGFEGGDFCDFSYLPDVMKLVIFLQGWQNQVIVTCQQLGQQPLSVGRSARVYVVRQGF